MVYYVARVLQSEGSISRNMGFCVPKGVDRRIGSQIIPSGVTFCIELYRTVAYNYITSGHILYKIKLRFPNHVRLYYQHRIVLHEKIQ